MGVEVAGGRVEGGEIDEGGLRGGFGKGESWFGKEGVERGRGEGAG